MTGPLKLSVAIEPFALKAPFRITGHTFTSVDVVVATLTDANGLTGRGEAAGVYYLNDDKTHIVSTIESARSSIEQGIDRATLQRLLPAGGARNAVDCALWELDAKRAKRAAWQLAGVSTPKPLLTTCTLGADDPDVMVKGAKGFADARALKLKLTGEPVDADRIKAVREARPDVWIGVDANQGFTRPFLEKLMPLLVATDIQLIEQPFRRGDEAQLDGFQSPIQIAADESVLETKDIASLVGRFQVVNIKLDKCGGLTEALRMAEESKRLGLDVMVGNMTGTTLAMAPAFIVGQLCQVVDLDGPLILRQDRVPSVVYEKGCISSPESVWGGTASAKAK